jgi:hypothetical protein
MENENIKPPPAGLIPEYFVIQKRFNEVCNAIARYYQAGEIIPLEWVQEYNELIPKIKKYYKENGK